MQMALSGDMLKGTSVEGTMHRSSTAPGKSQVRTQKTGVMERQLPLLGEERQTGPAQGESLLWASGPQPVLYNWRRQARLPKMEKKIRNHMRMKTSISF